MITINDGINLLSLYFLENNTLKLADLHKLVPKEFKKPEEKEAVNAALIGSLNSEQFSPLVQLVTPIASDITSYYWVLKKPLFQNTQQLTINGTLALQIAQIVNSFINNKNGQSNPLEINENDIHHLVNIIEFLSNEESEKPTEQKQKI